MTEQDKQKAQQMLNEDYARYLAEVKAAKAEGRVLGTFNGWMHLHGQMSIKIPKRGCGD